MTARMKILIGYDGSECAKAALDDLRLAGLPAEAETIVLSVADVWLWPDDESGPPPVKVDMIGLEKARSEALKAVERAQGLAVEARDSLKKQFAGWDVRAESEADSPAWALIKRADQWEPDLTVVGSHGRSALGRFVLGSVSQKVLNESGRPVRIARGRANRGDSPPRIVIGTDGSRWADTAIQTVADRNWPAGTEVRLVAVPELTLFVTPEWVADLSEDEQIWARKVIESGEIKLRDAGLAVSSLIKRGDAKRTLVQEAEAWRADCVFLGARGVRGVGRLFLGSVSSAVAARAHCSVEVVHLPDKE
jgi:nucleotide-binding universal stress UspA family protein